MLWNRNFMCLVSTKTQTEKSRYLSVYQYQWLPCRLRMCVPLSFLWVILVAIMRVFWFYAHESWWCCSIWIPNCLGCDQHISTGYCLGCDQHISTGYICFDYQHFQTPVELVLIFFYLTIDFSINGLCTENFTLAMQQEWS